ncbi:MAG: fasciclin domain-containing protein [Phormidesmis sp.]
MRFSTSAKSLKKLSSLAVALMILPVAVACGNQQEATTVDSAAEAPADTTAPDAMPAVTEGETVVDVAEANGSFSTLVAAIKAADLTETLNGAGPYTVFAPTDEAFAALPEGTLDKLLLPDNKEVLTQILTYHVVAGNVPSSEVETGAVPSVEGEDLDITADAGSVTVNGASVTQPDVMASNGVIHVIDQVLVPPTVDISTL